MRPLTGHIRKNYTISKCLFWLRGGSRIASK